ncbi:hypothetical protein C6P45_000007 [Maudiozyma exigua]|uniref:Zn(2)-C6 fungal-type domain-containing protein n=1 Tax=Maudiozyma exigua TaxID=34358 RepID=A0A9P6WF10_MAUEX|nr:hypothetical protein C6P45_000007 [Kazachstania exigua]
MPKKAITRKRKIRSCTYCYSHKLKCNRTIPCSTCITNAREVECKYWADSSDPPLKRPNTESYKTQMPQKLEWVLPQNEVYGGKFLYPFFTPSVNNDVVSPNVKSKLTLNTNFVRNKITEFNPFVRADIHMKDVIFYLEDTKAHLKELTDSYFSNIHPIVPILDRDDMESRIQVIYERIETNQNLSPLDVILLITICFCSCYSSMASGHTNNITRVYRYYSVYRYLLDMTKFPLVPYTETVQSFTVINFVMDPNMREAVAYSAMLVRLGQQLELYKKVNNTTQESKNLLYLWHYILFMEGSSSVASGFQFSASKDILNLVRLPKSPFNQDDANGVPYDYTISRFKMNSIFQKIMELTTKNSISRTESDYVEEKIGILYRDVGKVEGRLKHAFPETASYYSSSLYIFLHRLHLRFFALESLQLESTQKRNKNFEVSEKTQEKDMFWILERPLPLREEVVPLTLLLLLNTLERLVQPNCEKFNWYTRGSTVMQYLFVILRDISQNPIKTYPLASFVEPLYGSISFDIKEVIMCHPVAYKYKLIEELLRILELRLAPLWTDHELYKFLLVKIVKEKVWEACKEVIKANETQFFELSKCRLFIFCKTLQDSQNISFEDFVTNLEPNVFGLDAEKILVDWLMDI